MKSGNILIVEDERIVALDIQNSLEGMGFVVSAIVSSGEEAIRRAEEVHPDLVLMDIVLKGDMDGIETGNRIRSQYNIPVVYLTAFADEKLVERAKITGPFGYIIKPFDDRELRSAIGIALYKHEADEEILKSREQLRALATYLQSSREQERISISRKIHDDLGQSMTALKMDLSWLSKRLSEDQKPLIEKTKSMEKIIDMMIDTARRIHTELRPSLLDDLGLAEAIRWQSEQLQDRAGIECEIDSEDVELDQDHSTAIFRIFQETLTNIARHANATRVRVSLNTQGRELVLKVSDNGVGITENQISHPESFGLIGMRERAHVLGGRVEIEGRRDRGTTIKVSMPFEKTG